MRRALLLMILLCAAAASAKKPKRAPDPKAAMVQALDARGDAVAACANPTPGSPLTVEVQLIVNAGGQLLDCKVTTSQAPNDEPLRRCVEKALRAAPYPRLPQKTPLLTMERKWTFRLEPQ